MATRGRTLLLLGSALFAIHPAVAQSRDSARRVMIVPEDLFQYADSLKCDQVSDFYEGRPGVEDPPFVYVDSLLPWWENTSALWCRPREGPKNRYTLLFRFGSPNAPMARCPPRIDNRQHIGGLSVVHGLRLTLDDFYYVDEPRKTGAKVPAAGDAIREVYDGTGTIYYCYEGRWLAFMLH